MCHGCNQEGWADAGITPMAFFDVTPAGRRHKMHLVYRLLLALGGDDWISGSLHVQVDDDNHDVDWEPEMLRFALEGRELAESVAGMAWNALFPLERLLVLAWLHHYWAEVPSPSPIGPVIGAYSPYPQRT